MSGEAARREDAAAPPRHLSLVDATAIFVGIVLGSGIFVAPSAVAAATGAPAVALALWASGAVVAACGAACYAECAARMPENGGFFVFHREVYGPAVAFVGGWAAIFVTYPASMAAIALVLARYLGGAVGLAGRERLVAAAALLAAGAINAAGLRAGPRAQVLVTAAKIAALALLGAAALLASTGGGAAGGAAAAPTGPGVWLAAALTVLWSYDGWSDVTLVAGEVRDPGRNIGRAVVVGTAILFSIYALVQAAVLRALPGGAAAASASPVAEAVGRTLGEEAGRGVGLLVVVSTFGAILGVVLTVSRLASAMARRGAFLRWFGPVHERTGTPVRAIGAMVAASIVYVASSGFRQILTYFTFSVWIFYGLTAAALIVLRRRGVGDPSGWRAPLGWLPPLVVLGAGTALTAQIVVHEPASAAAGAAVLLLAVPVYGLVRRQRAGRR